jgi:hypothetical protein
MPWCAWRRNEAATVAGTGPLTADVAGAATPQIRVRHCPAATHSASRPGAASSPAVNGTHARSPPTRDGTRRGAELRDSGDAEMACMLLLQLACRRMAVGRLVFAVGAVFCGDVHAVRPVFCCLKTTGYPQLGMCT